MARLLAAHEGFESGRNVKFVDFERSRECNRGCVVPSAVLAAACRPLVEVTRTECVVGSRVVATTKFNQETIFTSGKVDDKGPDECRYLQFAVAFDHAEEVGVVFQHHRGKRLVRRRSIRGEGFCCAQTFHLIPFRKVRR